MKPPFALAILLICAPQLSKASNEEMYFPGETWEVVEPAEEQIDRSMMLAALAYLEAECGQDGVTEAMLIRRGRVVWEGPRVDSRHAVYSCTKSYASVLAGALISDGKLTLDTRLAEVIPEYAAQYPDLTVRHALSLTDGYLGDPLQRWIPEKPRAEPGKTFHYGKDTALLALGRVLQAAAGETLESFFRHRVAEPIGYTRAIHWDDIGLVDGKPLNTVATGFSTNARSMARLGHLLLNEGRWNGKQIVSTKYLSEATRVQAGLKPQVYDPEDWYTSIHGAYGYLFWVNGVRDDGKRIWPSAPERTYAMVGNRNNVCFVIPGWDIVFVRLGADKIIGPESYDKFISLLRQSLLDDE